MLRIEGVNQYCGGSHILRDIGLEVQAGRSSCIVGRRGVGKTTLLKCIMGLLPVASGRILVRGEDVTHTRPEARVRIGVGYVSQRREIFPQLTVEQNLRLPLVTRRASDLPGYIYDLFPALAELGGRRSGELSRGRQQQIAIARALVLDPQILLLDEPVKGLKPGIVEEISDVIRVLNRERGLTILLVEQKLPFARATADHFAIINNGRTVASGEMDQLGDELIQEHLTI